MRPLMGVDVKIWFLWALFLGILLLPACRDQDDLEQSGFVSGDYAFVARDRQLHVVDIARPDQPHWVATTDLPGRIASVEVKGRYAYVAYHPSVDSWVGNPPDGGMEVIDISNPRRPMSVGFYHTLSLAQDIAVTEQVAFIADWDGLRVVDIRNPTGPVEITTLTDGVNGVTIAGQTLLAVWGNCSIRTSFCAGGLWIFDIASPLNPIEVGMYSPDQIPGYSVALAGDRAYVAGKGLWQVDLTRPADPAPGPVYELFEGRYQAHVAVLRSDAGEFTLLLSDKGLRVLDISVPDHLNEVAFLPMSAFIMDAAVRGDYLYTISNEGLHVIDMRDPTEPVVVGYYSGVR